MVSGASRLPGGRWPIKWQLFVGMMPSSSQSPKACRRAKLLGIPGPCPAQGQRTPAGPLSLGSVPPEARCPCCRRTGTWPPPDLLPLTAHFQVPVPSTPGAPGPEDPGPPPRGHRAMLLLRSTKCPKEPGLLGAGGQAGNPGAHQA